MAESPQRDFRMNTTTVWGFCIETVHKEDVKYIFSDSEDSDNKQINIGDNLFVTIISDTRNGKDVSYIHDSYNNVESAIRSHNQASLESHFDHDKFSPNKDIKLLPIKMEYRPSKLI